MNTTTNYITRNIGIMAHIDAGKTTLTERLLYYSGRIHKIGEVHGRNTTMDTTPEEMEKKITIKSAATSVHWSCANITIIDTPGHVDFFVEVERSLRVLDGAVALFCAKGAVEAQSETIWRQANKYGVPRVAFVNKMDIEGADFYNVIYEIKKKLLAKPLPVMLPIGKGKEFVGIIDVLLNKAYYYDVDETSVEQQNGDVKKINYEEKDVPEEYRDEVNQCKRDIILAVAEDNEDIFNAFFEGGEDPQCVPVSDIKRALRKATCERKLVPVFCGSAYKNKGAQQLLDGIIDYLPSPEDRGAIRGTNPVTNEETFRLSKVDEPFSAIAFNIGLIGAGANDDTKQRGVYIRVYSGVLDRKSRKIYNPNKNCMETVNKLCRMHSNKPIEVEELKAGEIGVLVGLSNNTVTGNTLCDKEHPIVYGAMTFPEPVVKMSIEPKTKAGKEQMQKAFEKLQLEDPTFKVYEDSKTGQTIIAGMGELYLDVIIKRLRREFKVEASVGQPQVSYKEKLKDDVEIEGECIRTMGIKPNVRQQFAKVNVAFELLTEGGENKFIVDVAPEVLPQSFAEAALKGIEASAMGGVLGYGLVEMRARIIGGEFRSGESSEMAFSYAGQQAMQNAMEKMGVVLLEPIMRVEIEFPEDNMKFNSNVISIITKHRGNVVDAIERNGLKVVYADIPLKEMLGLSGFAIDLRGATQSRGSYTMKFNNYAVCTDKNVGGIY